jgi:superfamily II DNA/RNA helicase
MTTFADLGVPAAVSKSLAAQGITSPFPIQTKTLPDSLSGRDVLGRGRTGSGKTLAFTLPLVSRLAQSGAARRAARKPRGLVLAPTRELATQINNTVQPLAEALGLNTTVIYGGVPQQRQERALAAGVDIVIACPGRLEDLLRQGVVSLSTVEITVLDEADHMADFGFLPTVRKILNATPSGQRLLFSATLDNGVDKIVKAYLNKPVTHSVDEPKAAVSSMEHKVFAVADTGAKKQLVSTLASGTGRRVLFTRTKHHARKLAKSLTAEGIPAVDLHGNLSQNARDRNLAAFSNGSVRVLVATDVAARGVHVDDVELVVHVDPPTEHKSYLHRSGRTARAGAAGTVVTISTPEQRRDVQKLMRAAGVTADIDSVSATSPAVTDLVGEVAPKVHGPLPTERPSAGNRPKAAGSGQGRRRRKPADRQGAGSRSAERGGGHSGAGRSESGRGGAQSQKRSGSARSASRTSNHQRSGHNGSGRGGSGRVGAGRGRQAAANR